MDDGTDTIDADTRQSRSIEDQPLGDICAGCVELTQRLEQLEQRLTQLESPASPGPLGTRACYWLCVGFHALLAFVWFGSENWTTYGYVFVIGACGTLAVSHVLSTRLLIEKSLRTALAGGIVLGAIILALWMSDQIQAADLDDWGAMLAFYLPTMSLSAWLAAKVCVWTRRWRIVPPGGSQEFCQLKIRDLMWITLAVALVFWLLRSSAIAAAIDDLGDEWLNIIIYLSAPAGTATLVAVFLARVLLANRKSVSLLALAVVMIGGTLSVVCVYGVITEFNIDAEWSEFLYYVVIATCYGTISPVVTFILMRIGGYRFAFPAVRTETQ